MVLTTQDANRTFLSYLGAKQELHLTPQVTSAVSRSRLMLIEGYLWEMAGAAEAIGEAIRTAKASGTMVAMTAGDAAVVQRHRGELWQALRQGVDLFFMNRRARCPRTACSLSGVPVPGLYSLSLRSLHVT